MEEPQEQQKDVNVMVDNESSSQQNLKEFSFLNVFLGGGVLNHVNTQS